MPVIAKRLADTAAKYASVLNSSLAARLQSFDAGWQSVSNQQQQTQASLSNGRNDLSAARRTLEITLLHILHQVAERFPGDVTQCSSLFNFGFLEAPKSHREKAPTAIGSNPTA